MQGASDSNADRGTAADDLEEVEDDLLPQDLLLGDLDITSQDISLKGAPMHSPYGCSHILAQDGRAHLVGRISRLLVLGQTARALQTIRVKTEEVPTLWSWSRLRLRGVTAGVDDELDRSAGHEVLRAILDQGCDPKEYGRHYGARLRQAELESIQDYLSESDNLVTLHQQVHTNAHSCMLCTAMVLVSFPPAAYAMLHQYVGRQ